MDIWLNVWLYCIDRSFKLKSSTLIFRHNYITPLKYPVERISLCKEQTRLCREQIRMLRISIICHIHRDGAFLFVSFLECGVVLSVLLENSDFFIIPNKLIELSSSIYFRYKRRQIKNNITVWPAWTVPKSGFPTRRTL